MSDAGSFEFIHEQRAAAGTGTPVPLPGDPPCGHAQHLSEAMKVFDFKAILQPRPFSGKEQDFRGWDKDLRNTLIPWGIKHLLDAAVDDEEEPTLNRMSENQRSWSKMLYAVLAGIVRDAGRAKMLVDTVEDENGFLAYRRLKR